MCILSYVCVCVSRTHTCVTHKRHPPVSDERMMLHRRWEWRAPCLITMLAPSSKSVWVAVYPEDGLCWLALVSDTTLSSRSHQSIWHRFHSVSGIVNLIPLVYLLYIFPSFLLSLPFFFPYLVFYSSDEIRKVMTWLNFYFFFFFFLFIFLIYFFFSFHLFSLLLVSLSLWSVVNNS